MDKKIIAIMVALLLVAVTVLAIVAAFSGGGGLSGGGGFTDLFDDLEYNGNLTYGQQLSLPDNWDIGDTKKVNDVIVDISYRERDVEGTTVYVTTMWFVYLGHKWNDPYQPWDNHGSLFYVPVTHDVSSDGWLDVRNNMFSITVSSATNLSRSYDIGDDITLECVLDVNQYMALAFDKWIVSDTI